MGSMRALHFAPEKERERGGGEERPTQCPYSLLQLGVLVGEEGMGRQQQALGVLRTHFKRFLFLWGLFIGIPVLNYEQRVFKKRKEASSPPS